jgi:hypothetical protein
MLSGRTKPGLFSCSNEEGECRDYVVKFCSQLESRIVFEFMAALLGQQLGLHIPAIATVEIDPAFATMIMVRDESICQSIADGGIHFGSLHMSGGYDTVPFPVPRQLKSEVVGIFVFGPPPF